MLLTASEAAQLMRVNQRTIRRLVEQGKLTAKRVGRQIRLPLDQFSDFIDVAAVKAEIDRRAAEHAKAALANRLHRRGAGAPTAPAPRPDEEVEG